MVIDVMGDSMPLSTLRSKNLVPVLPRRSCEYSEPAARAQLKCHMPQI